MIIGGGSGGISVASRLKRQLKNADIAIVEPNEKHYYQPYWTLVGAGIVPREASERSQASVMPKGVTWIRDRLQDIDADHNQVTLATGGTVDYDYLVVTPGLQIDWDKVQGLKEALGRDGVCSIYDYRQAEKTWEMIRTFRGGHATGQPQSQDQPLKFVANEKFQVQTDEAVANGWR